MTSRWPRCQDHASTDLAQRVMQVAGAETIPTGVPQAFYSAAKQDEVQPWTGSPSTNQGREQCADMYGTPSATTLPVCMNNPAINADFDAGDQGVADGNTKVSGSICC